VGIGRSIASLFVRLGLDPSGVKRGAAETRSGVTGLRRDVEGAGGSANLLDAALSKIGTVGLVLAAGKAVDLTWELGKAGAQALQVEGALRDLTRSAGTDMNELVDAVRAASGGTVNEFETMLALNRGILLQMGTDVQDWTDLMEVARFRARAMGISTSQALSDITTGIGRESRMILDNLGIILDTDAAVQQYARTHGLAAEELDAFQRKEAIKAAVIAEGKAQIEAAGGMTETYADKIAAAESAADDAAMMLKQALAPAVAEVAGAIAQAIPDLMTTVEQLSILADAGIEWAQAALEGRDAQAEFNATVAEGVGDAQNAARIRLEAAQAVVDGLTAERDALLEARDAGVEVYQSHIDMANAELAAAEAERDAAAAALEGAAATAELNAELASTPAAAVAAASGLNIFAQAAGNWFTTYKGIVSKVPEPFREVWGIIDAEQERLRVNFIRDAVLKGDAEKEAARGTQDAWKRAIQEQERGLEELRGVIQSALTPTRVTAEDMGLAAIGQYIEKWDENARRLDAVAERGFGELDAHPDWAGMLEIPANVLAAGEQALKDWARRTAESVRGLERPDLLNIDAAVQAVQEELNRQAAVELSLDLVTQAAIDEGLVTGEDAKDQVAAALGLSQALPVSLTVSDDEKERFVAGIGSVPVPVTFSVGETEGAEAGGLQEMMATAVDGVAAGWEQSLQEVPWMQTLSVTMLADIKASEGRLKEVGAAIGAPLWAGLLGRIRGSGIVSHIVAEVLAALVKETK